MDNSYQHLGPLALPFVDLAPAERIRKIRRGEYTDLPRCRHVMEVLNNSVDSNSNLLFWGESGVGKSTIIQRYLLEHPARFVKSTGVRETPVIAIFMPPVCDPKWLYMNLLDAAGAPQPSTRPQLSQLEKRTIELFQTMKVRQVLIDEVHDMMTGTGRQQRIMLNVIRHLINEISIPLALFGTQAARTALIPESPIGAPVSCS